MHAWSAQHTVKITTQVKVQSMYEKHGCKIDIITEEDHQCFCLSHAKPSVVFKHLWTTVSEHNVSGQEADEWNPCRVKNDCMICNSLHSLAQHRNTR
ncbi:hypothetical protein ID866_7532 [Astraeus odoratus]|nr:hypothetical protein ID866_7532 [Astraeus odoratus]